jgi:hypothetical protein
MAIVTEHLQLISTLCWRRHKKGLRLEKQKQMKQKKIRRMETEISRVNKFEVNRMQVTREKAHGIEQLTHQKLKLRENMLASTMRNRIDRRKIKRSAQEYDIDVRAIQSRYERPRSGRGQL